MRSLGWRTFARITACYAALVSGVHFNIKSSQKCRIVISSCPHLYITDTVYIHVPQGCYVRLRKRNHLGRVVGGGGEEGGEEGEGQRRRRGSTAHQGAVPVPVRVARKNGSHGKRRQRNEPGSEVHVHLLDHNFILCQGECSN